MKDKQWKEYWEVDLGVSYIPIDKLDPQTNMSELEEGGTFDDDTMPEWMKTMRGVAPGSAGAGQAGFGGVTAHGFGMPSLGGAGGASGAPGDAANLVGVRLDA